MSGLQNFLTPFSHLVFANRDKVIVLLAGLLALVTVQLLVARWRNERLHRDLASAKSGGPSGGGRRYATNAPAVEEAPAESGGALPPVKGGRTYARNLGTALQKAGMSPQIYSPPSPAGWAPNTNPPQQPSVTQPPYAPQNVPWAAPAAPQGAPWGAGYPGSAGRGMPGPAPSPVPFYQPQPPPPPQPMSQPIAPPPGVPGPYAPPVGSPFGPPVFPVVTSGPAAPPGFAPPGMPGGPSAPPSMPTLPTPEPPAAEPAGDAGRRGKPKRRRFNFNVLENLEKMVLPKSEPLPPAGWVPPVSPPSTGSWTPPASAPAVTPTAPAPPAPTVPSMPTASTQGTPGTEESPAAEEAPAEAESLSLPFNQPAEAKAEESEPAIAEKEPEPEAAVVSQAEAPVVEPEPEPEPEPKRDARGSMRAMLFGEEVASAPEPAPTPAPAEAEAEPASAEHRWAAREATPEPVAPTVEADPRRPWNAAPEPEPETHPEPEVVSATEPETTPAADVPETPVADGGGGPSAGTVVIIEDDPVAANYYATLFRGNGYQVQVANDGVSGVDVCTRVQPQVILLDVMMPRQNGILVLQTLRASDETKNTPVVVMSNFSEPTLIKRAIQLGALEYVIKTQVEGPALLSALPRWMNHEKAFAAA